MAKQSIAEARKNEASKPSETPKFHMTEAQLHQECKDAIKISHDAFPVVQRAFINATLFMATHGRPDYMNMLMSELRPEHAHGASRYFLSRLFRDHGQWLTFDPVEKTADGKYLKGFKFYKPNANNPKGAKALEASKAGRAKTIELGFDGLKRIPWMQPENVGSGGIMWGTDDFGKAIKRDLTRALREGAITKAEAEQFNKLLDAKHKLDWDAITIPTAEEIAAMRAAKGLPPLNASGETTH